MHALIAANFGEHAAAGTLRQALLAGVFLQGFAPRVPWGLLWRVTLRLPLVEYILP